MRPRGRRRAPLSPCRRKRIPSSVVVRSLDSHSHNSLFAPMETTGAVTEIWDSLYLLYLNVTSLQSVWVVSVFDELRRL